MFVSAKALSHARYPHAMEPFSGKLEPIIHCELLGGLFKGESYLDCKPDRDVYDILKELEGRAREVAIVHTTFNRSAEKLIDRHFRGERGWKIKSRLMTGAEWDARSTGELPRAEMIITPFTKDRMPLDATAHATMLTADELVLRR